MIAGDLRSKKKKATLVDVQSWEAVALDDIFDGL
jgi:hypothetical protein